MHDIKQENDIIIIKLIEVQYLIENKFRGQVEKALATVKSV